MSIYYYAEATIYAPFNYETIYILLNLCYQKSYILKDHDYHLLNKDKAINYVLQGIDDPVYHAINIQFNEKVYGSLLFLKRTDTLTLSLPINRREYVLNGHNEKECINPSLYLLDVTVNFRLQNFFVTHDAEGLFEPTIANNIFYVLTHSTYPKEKNFCARDAFYIIRQLRNIGCSFITKLDTEIDQDELIKKIADMLLTPKNSVSEENGLIIKTTNGSLIKATFFNYAFQFLPLHPWTMKKIEGRDSIDVAYYTKILLAMAEPFGIIELATHCNNAFYQ